MKKLLPVIEMAPLYGKLHRDIQKWCVEACSVHGWEIPFPQLTVHRAEAQQMAFVE
jgi:small-conductance mechanosensitive channel